MLIELEAFKTSERLPDANTPVIVRGGIAYWDGERWRTMMDRCGYHPIQWEVKWWIPIAFADECDELAPAIRFGETL